MSDFRKNPKRPYEVKIPNKIRKRLSMHYTKESSIKRGRTNTTLRKLLAMPLVPVAGEKGSMWSRFKNFIQFKTPKGRLK